MKSIIESGKAVLGIELGSTRIKAVLTGPGHKPVAQGSHTWENRLTPEGLWTYSLDDIHRGMQLAYADLSRDVETRYGVKLTSVAAAGVSAMMHGYMPFDANGKMLAEFRTWRCTNTGRAAEDLSKRFSFNIPLRWSISHIYQAMLDKEAHVKDIAFLTTLAGYVHWMLTGEKVLGVGDASGMLPINPATGTYNQKMVDEFDKVAAEMGYTFQLQDILPKVLPAGTAAGTLTEEGAKWLDPTGTLKAGALLCPPEGDAGTGMVATNAVRPRTGNVSAGTSSFSMIVLEKELSQPYEPIDIVTTPDGAPVAMVHCNNCTSDLNAWVGMLGETLSLFGVKPSPDELYGKLYNKALEGEADCGGLVAYNYVSGEPVMGLKDGAPLQMRKAGDAFNLANFMRANLYASVAVLKVGNDILFNKEHVKVDRLTGHGGLFKTPVVGQRVLAAALATPVTVMETAGEGGAWGIALLAAYAGDTKGMSLSDWLDLEVFQGAEGTVMEPVAADVAGFDTYTKKYINCLPVEAEAAKR